MVFGDLNDGAGELRQRLRQEPSSQLRAELALNTGVRYQGL
jgi:molybdopterin-containing oxidoreductase family iron-sulfur binding subunit